MPIPEIAHVNPVIFAGLVGMYDIARLEVVLQATMAIGNQL